MTVNKEVNGSKIHIICRTSCVACNTEDHEQAGLHDSL